MPRALIQLLAASRARLLAAAHALCIPPSCQQGPPEEQECSFKEVMHGVVTHQSLVKDTIFCRLLLLHLGVPNPLVHLRNVCLLAAHSSQGKTRVGQNCSALLQARLFKFLEYC